MSSLRDIALVARFEVLRAVRTWRAIALFLLYAVSTCGAAYLFVQLIGVMENALARQLGVAETRVPGAMLQELIQSDSFRSMIVAMAGSEQAADQVLGIPVLAIYNLWLGFILIPFFAASTSAESVAIDAGSRALRFEVLRTGRLELVLGRYLGQVALTGMATLLAVGGVFVVGMLAMRGNAALPLIFWLSWLSLRTWFFSMPFVGVGLATSQLTTSPAWARVLAVGLTAGSWLVYGLLRWTEQTRWAVLADFGLQVLPQGWMRLMWEPTGWAVAAGVCAALGVVATLGGYVRFAGKDL